MHELILYTSDDGQTRLHLRSEDESLWLSQLEIAELFQTTKQNVSLHAKNIFADNELAPEATVKASLTVQSEGGASGQTALFFAEVQNKLLYAVTGHTAAELVVGRADAGRPNMALTAWSGSRVRKQDVIVAKNYLNQDEIDTLNRLTVIFLEQAELRVKQRRDLSLDFWRDNVDKMLAFNEQPILAGAGSVRREQMERVAHERYELFDQQRRKAERLQADAEDLRQIEQLEDALKAQEKKHER